MFIDESVLKYVRASLRKSEGLLGEIETYAKENHVPISRPEMAAFIRSVCALKKPFKILEAGTAIGYSSIIMSEYLQEGGRIDTVERDEDTAHIAMMNIQKAGLQDKINVIVADALEVFTYIDGQYDIIYLDASKSQYTEMYIEAKRLLNKNGILICDNVLFMGRVANEGLPSRKFRTIVTNMRRFIEIICNDPDFETSILTIGDGTALCVKK